MRWLSSAIWTSGEPVSPSVVAYSAMIFFLVSASVPIDMRGSSRFSLRGAPGPVHPGTGIRGRLHGGGVPARQPRWDDLDEVLWSATVDGAVVGMAQLSMGHHDNRHLAETTVFVHPEHRRRGIG